MSLFTAAERLARLDSGSTVTFDEDRCLHSLDRYASCTACLDLCPNDAITPGKPPLFDAGKCQHCLACLTVCPTGAYSASDEVANLLNAATHLDGSTLELVCEMNPQAARGSVESCTGISIRGCLAGLGPGAYLALFALGLEKIILRMEACDSCEWTLLSRHVKAQVEQAQRFLEGWGKADILETMDNLDLAIERPLWEAKNPPLSRRDLFTLAIRQGQIALARSMEEGPSTPGHTLGRNRRRVLIALSHLPEPGMPEKIQLGEANFANLFVADVCTACAACARSCPTGALHFEKNEETNKYKLTFSARDCVACDICLHVCAPLALTVERMPTYQQVLAQEWVTLHEGDLVKCSSCGTMTAALPGGSLCPVCDYRQSNPFGSRLPPGLKSVQHAVSEEKKGD